MTRTAWILRWVMLAALGLLAGCNGDPFASSENGDGTAAPSPPPVFSGGTCPTLVAGENTMTSAGIERRVLIDLPAEPNGRPVLFGWHWLEGDPYQFLFATGLFSRPGVIIVVPFSTGDQLFQWHMQQGPVGNPDLVLFDDVLACLDQQFGVDEARIWSMGVSAGALWNAYLTQYRADRLASAVMISGGLPDPNLAPAYVTPAAPIPVELVWGGDNDVFNVPGANFAFNNGDPSTFSFAVASRALADLLRADGHFVLECVGAFGHATPPDPVSLWWPFLRDHPKGVTPEPYLTSFPADLSPLCTM